LNTQNPAKIIFDYSPPCDSDVPVKMGKEETSPAPKGTLYSYIFDYNINKFSHEMPLKMKKKKTLR